MVVAFIFFYMNMKRHVYVNCICSCANNINDNYDPKIHTKVIYRECLKVTSIVKVYISLSKS
ncbi:hypothetical protein FF38_08482 [Lucilia cuprina]|uniref:Uncharacterized protein n=1 Tax=Lucilia cuprina TaxID=7375 RepID=A0A0L0CDJ4_LUCCU|nr:hypothetical protein FF38_08482 [Lucilia cuprina]